MLSIYKNTIRKSNAGTIFAFGREKALDGHPVEKGGYCVWVLRENYNGKVRGGMSKTWRYVKRDLSFNEAIEVMNRRLGRKEFEEK